TSRSAGRNGAFALTRSRRSWSAERMRIALALVLLAAAAARAANPCPDEPGLDGLACRVAALAERGGADVAAVQSRLAHAPPAGAGGGPPLGSALRVTPPARAESSAACGSRSAGSATTPTSR